MEQNGSSYVGSAGTFGTKVIAGEVAHDLTKVIYSKVCDIDLNNCDERMSGGRVPGSTTSNEA